MRRAFVASNSTIFESYAAFSGNILASRKTPTSFNKGFNHDTLYSPNYLQAVNYQVPAGRQAGSHLMNLPVPKPSVVQSHRVDGCSPASSGPIGEWLCYFADKAIDMWRTTDSTWWWGWLELASERSLLSETPRGRRWAARRKKWSLSLRRARWSRSNPAEGMAIITREATPHITYLLDASRWCVCKSTDQVQIRLKWAL